MLEYVESYGNTLKKYKFIALRFKKPILRFRLKGKVEKINTGNILVVNSKEPITLDFSTLTFAVNTPCYTNAINVSSGKIPDLLLSLLDRCEVYEYYFHDSVLFVVGSNLLNIEGLEIIPKTKTFKMLYGITKNCLNQTFNIEHLEMCKYFKRNTLEWKKWNSWWHFIQNLIKKNSLFDSITLQNAKLISNIYSKSQQEYRIDYTDLYKCEIELGEKSFLGIMYKVENNNLIYVSPMIVSKPKDFFNDLNYVTCNHWIPLYFNKTSWLSNGMYFYLQNLRKNIIDLEKILNYLKHTTVEKYLFINNDLKIVYSILTSKPNSSLIKNVSYLSNENKAML